MTIYLMYGAYKPYTKEDKEWTCQLEEDLYTGDCPDVGEIHMLRGCNPFEADTICIGQILVKIDQLGIDLQQVDMDHLRVTDIHLMLEMHAKERQDQFSSLGVFLFSVFD